MKIVAGSILFITSTAFAVDPCWGSARWSNFLYALRQTETGGQVNGGVGAIGDGGKAIGPYQLHEEYFIDAVRYDSSLSTHSYQECLRDKELSERVVVAYMKRYLPANADEGTAARIHNGGCNGHKKKSTLKYLARFMRFFTGK